jgi:hypothetical protein
VRLFHLLYGDHARLARTESLDALLETLEADLHLTVAELARRRVFLHAGVVGWKGEAIVIPGRSYTGKSTLVSALLRAGATYYSDEYAVLDSAGRVHPYPRRLSIRQGESDPPLRCGPEAFGSTSGRNPLPVGRVVLAEYREGAGWRPRRLSPGHGALALLRNAVPARRAPEEALAVCRVVAENATFFRGVRGEAERVARFLLGGE